jgi:hypothetical protein
MAVIGSVRALEQIDEEETARAPRQQMPGFVIVIQNAPANTGPAAIVRPAVTIDHQADEDEPPEHVR